MSTYTKAFKPQKADGSPGEWFWHTVAGSDLVADSGESYHNLEDAINGYLASQDISVEDRDLARQALAKIKLTPNEYEFKFDRNLFDKLKKKQEKKDGSQE